MTTNPILTTKDSREWAGEGRQLFLSLLDRLSDDSLREPSRLPGWTRAHVAAHIGNNARGLRNLLEWARTGVEKPMYPSVQARADDIESGSRRAPQELRDYVREQSEALHDEFEELTRDQWRFRVRVISGREIPVTELSWYRAREVMVHSVDLDAGVLFADLPQAFNAALIEESVRLRSDKGDGPALILKTMDRRGVERIWDVRGEGEPIVVYGPLHSAASWMTGRRVKLLKREDGLELPRLTPWL